MKKKILCCVIFSLNSRPAFSERDESWAPYIICFAGHTMLCKCKYSGNNGSLKLTIPEIRKKPRNEWDCKLLHKRCEEVGDHKKNSYFQ